jgi:hypothetical protein
MNSNIFVGLFLALALYSSALTAANAPGQKSVARLPVLSDCLGEAKAKIGNYERFNAQSGTPNLEAKYIEFDGKLSSHPTLVGFVEVLSSDYDAEFVTSIARGIIEDCQMSGSIEFKKSNPHERDGLFLFIKSVEQEGGRPLYLINETDSIRLLFRDEE